MLTEKDIDKVLESLRENGLKASARKQKDIEIIGGTEERDAGVFSTFKNGFSISLEGNRWICRMPGEGQAIVERVASNLPDATRLVCEYYSSLPEGFFD